MAAVAIIVLLVCVFSPTSSGDCTKEATRTFVGKQDVKDSARLDVIPGVISKQVCGNIAGQKGWPTLVCYEDDNCILSSLKSPPGQESSGLVDPIECYTTESIIPTCEAPGGGVIPSGEGAIIGPDAVFCNNGRLEPGCQLPNKKVVAQGGLLLNECVKHVCKSGVLHLAPAPQREIYDDGCPTNYTDSHENLGCVKAVYAPTMTWCEAREFCRVEGGDLLTADSRSFYKMQEFNGFMGAWSGALPWVGLRKTVSDGLWAWVGRGPAPLDNMQSLLQDGHMNTESKLWQDKDDLEQATEDGEDCGVAVRNGKMFLDICTKKRSFICQILI